MISNFTRSPISQRCVATAILAVIAAGIVTIVASPAEAARCGGANQRPCKIWERVPSCDRGLVEDFARGICKKKPAPKPIIKRPNNCGAAGQKPCPLPHIPSCNGRLVEDFAKGVCRSSNADIVNMAKDTLAQSGSLIKETGLALARCTGAKGIIEGGGSRADKANQLQRQPCVREMIEGARRAGYKSYSLGVGGGASFGIGGDVETGFVFDTAYKNPPAFYASYGYSLGIQAGVGGNLVAGYGTSPNTPSKSQGHGASIGAAAVGGSGASAWFNYDGSPDGISVVATVGGEFSAAYGRNETHVIAIPGARAEAPVETGPGPLPSPNPPSAAMISGNYYFVGNPQAVNGFRMVNSNLLQATNLRNGRPVKWHDYVRVSNTTFRARSGSPTYQLMSNGDLLWKSNRSDNKRVVLRRK